MLRVRYFKYISDDKEYMLFTHCFHFKTIFHELLDKFSAGFDQSPDESPGKSGKYRGVKLLIVSCIIDQDNYFNYMYCNILYRALRDKK